MDDNVGTVIQRVLDIGAEKGVVDDDHDAIAMCHGRHVADIHQAEGRVAWALNPDQLGFIRSDQLGNVDFDAGRERNLNPVGRSHLGEVSMSSTVDVRNGDHMRACSERLKD